MLFSVEDLIADAPPVVSVTPADIATVARRKMIENGYSQLPVTDGTGKSLGTAVTFRSILNALSSLGVTLDLLTVDDVMAPAQEVRMDADLLTVLDDIQGESFLLIVDAERKLRGIITTFDTTAHFRRYAEDLMVVEDIETMVRESIKTLYADDEVAAQIRKVIEKKGVKIEGFKRGLEHYLSKADPSIRPLEEETVAEAFAVIADGPQKKFENLSFNELAEILLKHPKCPRPALAKGVGELRRLLHEVRDIRNDLAHFRGEVAAERRDSLRYCSDWLGRRLPTAADALSETPSGIGSDNSEIGSIISGSEELPPSEEEPQAGDSTYAKLAVFLNAQPAQVHSRTLSFDQLEQVIQYSLPKSAKVHRTWWANDPNHPQAAQWLDVGWRAHGISMTEQRVTFIRIAEREEAYIYFFNSVMDRLRTAPEFPLKEASPQGASWHTFGQFSWVKPHSADLNGSFTRQKMLRIEVYIDCGVAATNKQAFDAIHSRKEHLEKTLGQLSWERMDERRSSRIAVYTPASISGEPVSLDRVADWAANKTLQFYAAFKPQFEAFTDERAP